MCMMVHSTQYHDQLSGLITLLVIFHIVTASDTIKTRSQREYIPKLEKSYRGQLGFA